MKTTRTLTLEFVRHGPPHNQLLSPLTEYLALCGNHGATSVFLPFEHHEFLLRLGAMRYQERSDRPEEASAKRAAHAREMGQLMSGILGAVPGLKADLGGCPQHPDELIHLQLVVSAAELALLPFEAALAPPGSPGAGRPLSLQTMMPMSLTRQVRRAFTPNRDWPMKPRILCIISSAGGAVPDEAHVRVLRAAIAPWVKPLEQATAKATNVGDMLTILTDASLAKISQACSEKAYTHVHILAHGRAFTVAGGTRFGLVLHDAKDPSRVEVVDGERLALALRSHGRFQDQELSRPSVVTVASCDSGNVDTVIAPGASLAHQLHEAEIPLVVASQFPLTFEGSVVLTHVLYSRMLWGGDPRIALHEARQQLKLLEGEIHDWASVVAYTSFPPDFESKLWTAQVKQAHDAVEAALARSGRLLDRLEPRARQDPSEASGTQAPTPEQLHEQLTVELRSLTVARDRLLAALPEARTQPKSAAEIYGHCASVEKRRAQILYQQQRWTQDRSRQRELALQLQASMEKSKSYYWEGLRQDFTSQWLATQYLCLCWLLDGRVERRWWQVAEASTRVDLASPIELTQRWAHGSLIEIYLLAPFVEPSPAGMQVGSRWIEFTPEEAYRAAIEHTQQFIQGVDRNSFPMLSTRRQFERYLTWFIPYLREQLGRELRLEAQEPDSKRLASVQRRFDALVPLDQVVQEILSLLPIPTSPAAQPPPV